MEIVVDGLGGEQNAYVRLTRNNMDTGVSLEVGNVDSARAAIRTRLSKEQVRTLSYALRSMEAALNVTPSTGS